MAGYVWLPIIASNSAPSDITVISSGIRVGYNDDDRDAYLLGFCVANELSGTKAKIAYVHTGSSVYYNPVILFHSETAYIAYLQIVRTIGDSFNRSTLSGQFNNGYVGFGFGFITTPQVVERKLNAAIPIHSSYDSAYNAMMDGDWSGGRTVSVPVQWHSKYRDEPYETTIEITVTES